MNYSSQTHSLKWEVGPHTSITDSPEAWIPAKVPGAVQLDWAQAHHWPEYWKGNHFQDYAWMEDRFWTYRAALHFPPLTKSERLFLVCRGIDYQFQIRIGEEVIHEQEGMFTPVEIDLTGRAEPGAQLLVTIHPAPKSVPNPPHREQANRSCKPAVSYGWDFHPRLIPLGIWDEAYLEIRPAARPVAAEVAATVSDDLSQAEVLLNINYSGSLPGRIRWTLFDPNQNRCFEKVITPQSGEQSWSASEAIASPRLWWPHDQGEPALYQSQVEWIDTEGKVLQSFRQRIGFRKVRLVMNEGAWQKPNTFPKSRSNPPITVEINGRRLFCKGTNWVAPTIFPGTLDEETYRTQLAMIRDSNLGLLRCWGGAVVNKESFFEICDELGIMVWQEFPLACNAYPDDPAYLRTLDQESRSIIHRLKAHPSVILWCGGNELFNAWSGMTDQSLPLRLLNRNCFDLDPQRPFLATSPVMGMGHGHYAFRDPVTGQEAFALFQKSNATAYPEFGCTGPAPVEVLQTMIPEDQLFPPRPGGVWESHGAFGAWLPESHLYLSTIEQYFGPSSSLDELVERGSLLQCEGYKGLFEEARRQKPAASMALNWCFNEPWPTAANCSLISWPAKPKPALSAVAAACRSILASARIRKFRWEEGDLFDPEIWLLSDSPTELFAGKIDVSLEAGALSIPLLTWNYSALPANTNQRGPKAQFHLPSFNTERLVLRLRVKGKPEFDSEYRLVYTKSTAQTESLTSPRIMNF